MEDGEENLEDTFLPSHKVLSTFPLLVFSPLLPLPPNPSICSSLYLCANPPNSPPVARLQIGEEGTGVEQSCLLFSLFVLRK